MRYCKDEENIIYPAIYGIQTDRNGKNAIGTTTKFTSVVLPNCIKCIENGCF